MGEIYLKTKSICILAASILLKGKLRLVSLKIFQTYAISHISSQIYKIMIGLQIYFK